MMYIGGEGVQEVPQGISTKLRRSVPCISTINSGLSAVVIGKVYVVEVLPAVRAATQLVRTRRGALATQTDAPCCMLRIACQGRWWLMVGFG